MHIHTHSCTHVHMHTHTYIYVQTFICTDMHGHSYTHIHTCMYTHVEHTGFSFHLTSLCSVKWIYNLLGILILSSASVCCLLLTLLHLRVLTRSLCHPDTLFPVSRLMPSLPSPAGSGSCLAPLSYSVTNPSPSEALFKALSFSSHLI